MKDQELFEIIKTVIKEKKAMPRQSETLTFAQRYCKQQMIKKKLNPHQPNQKMSHLMKNFTKLQTYVDLPELLNAIQVMKEAHPLQQKKQVHFLEQMSNSVNSKEQLANSIDKTLKLKHYFNDKRKLMYIINNENVKEMIKQLEKSTHLTTEALKNNSHSNVSNLLDMINRDSSDFSMENSNKLFQMLCKFKENQANFEFNDEQQKLEYKESCLNSSSKKNQCKFLHKVASYLQIILESQHKSKWKTNRKFKTLHLNSHSSLFGFGKTPRVKKLDKHSQKARTTIKCTDSSLNRQTALDSQVSSLSPAFESAVQNTTKQNLTSYRSGLVRTTTKLTEPLQEERTFKRVEQNKTFYSAKKNLKQSKVKVNIKDTFTFRKRTIKQKIINKLNQFIGEIDDQNYSSKKENQYYFDQINKLQKNYRKMYSRYRRETLVGEKDIENLTKLATAFQVTQFRKQSQTQYCCDEQSDDLLPAETYISNK